MSEKITNCYKAKDGKLIEGEIACNQYNIKLDFKGWYLNDENNQITRMLLPYGTLIEGIDGLIDWILKHPNEIANLIRIHGEEKDV